MANERNFGLPEDLINDVKNILDETAYSAKAGREGKDLGKPGKNFSKIADSAAKEYGSKEAGDRVAGAILKKIRAKHMKEERLNTIKSLNIKENKEMASKRISVGNLVEINNRVYEISGIDNKGVVLEDHYGQELVFDSKVLSEYVDLGYAEILGECQINEISKKTLGSYIKKAVTSRSNHDNSAWYNREKEHEYAQKADRQPSLAYKGSKQEKYFDKAEKYAGNAEGHERKVKNRLTGMGRAVNRLTKESNDFVDITEIFEPAMIDVGDIFEAEGETFVVVDMIGDMLRIMNEEEELLEISKKTLVNYMEKSKNQSKKLQKKYHAGTLTPEDEHKMDRRDRGQIMAQDKFYKRSKVKPSGKDKAFDLAQKIVTKESMNEDTVAYFKRIEE